MKEPRFPDIEVQLSGTSGNTGALMGRVAEAMRRGGVSQQDITEMRLAVMDADSYDAALRVFMETVSVS
jgi:hypothetical protein